MKNIFLCFVVPSLLIMNWKIEASQKQKFLLPRIIFGTIVGGYSGSIASGAATMAGAAVKEKFFPSISPDAKTIQTRKRFLEISMATGGAAGSYGGLRYLEVPKRISAVASLTMVVGVGLAYVRNCRDL